MKDDFRIWTLIGRKLAGEATKKETEELDDLLLENPDLHFGLQILSLCWNKRSRYRKHEFEEAFERHLHRMTAKSSDESGLEAFDQSFHLYSIKSAYENPTISSEEDQIFN